MTDESFSLDHLDLVPLAGSERPAAPGVQPAETPLSSHDPVEVTLVLRRKNAVDPGALTAPFDGAAFAQQYGADPSDIALVTSTLESLSLTIVDADQATRRVRVSGSSEVLAKVFGTTLESVTSDAPTRSSGSAPRVAHRHRSGGLSIPRALDGVVMAVLGLDDRPQARAQFRVSSPSAVSVSYTPLELGELYAFPAGTDGAAQPIAIIELGGGFEQSDLDTYFAGLGVGRPSVTAASVDGAVNKPGQDPAGADGEVLLDIEVVGSLAPKSPIVVYFAPNTDAGFVDAIAQATTASPTPVAMSISWGQSEDQWTAQARTALDDALIDAAAAGITVTVAAGDNGSSDNEVDAKNHVDFPASSPHALACGGTSLEGSGSTIRSETVWNDGAKGGATGGGVSDAFALPSWQNGFGVPASSSAAGGRGVPDVSGDADPETGYEVLIDGNRTVIGGTSAVAPLWAALIARFAQSLGSPLGLVQPQLYAASSTFHDITSGNNGAFSARPGWDACTGLGSPDGAALLAALKA